MKTPFLAHPSQTSPKRSQLNSRSKLESSLALSATNYLMPLKVWKSRLAQNWPHSHVRYQHRSLATVYPELAQRCL